jgi:hypothetical protein
MMDNGAAHLIQEVSVIRERSPETRKLDQLFAWLPRRIARAPSGTSVGPPLHLFTLAERLDQNGPLVGQDLPAFFPPLSFSDESPLAFRVRIESPEGGDQAALAVGLASQPQEIFQVRVDSISFQEGSLYAWVRGRIQVLTLATSLFTSGLGLLSNPVGAMIARQLDHHRMHERIELALKGSPLVRYRSFRFSEDELRDKAGASFNYEAPKISEDERRNRVGMVQLALNVNLGIELVVDGEVGSETKAAIKEFAKKHNHPATVTSPFLRADLLQALEGTR